MYARVIYGARPILTIAPIATAPSPSSSARCSGLIMGYYRGWVDEILSRIIEAILSIPVILMAILIVFTFGRSRAGHHRHDRRAVRAGDHPDDPIGLDRRSGAGLRDVGQDAR